MGGELARILEAPWMLADRVDEAQQPQWRKRQGYREACQHLASAPPLVTAAEVSEMQAALRLVAEGGVQLLQAGDCAESFAETGEEQTRAKLTLLHQLADQLAAGTGQRVVRVGRMGGQFAKPRSTPVEHVAGIALPAFRGHMINSEVPAPAARSHDPLRMVRAYDASAAVLDRVHADRATRTADAGDGPADGPWASHDALVLDYEANLVRHSQGRRFLASTHLPWIGDRTRDPDAPHVRLMATTANPVACKIGPSIRPDNLRELCARLDPDRVPGRLTLIVRLGRGAIAELLPTLVAAVRSLGHPVIWLCDPMHGNTIRADNRKTRLLADMVAEAREFRRILLRHGVHPGGLHVEVATSDVTECIGGAVRGAEQLATRYTTLCDPRLNPAQAAELIEGWLSA